MNNLEEYIKRNREAFDDEELPEGHEGRFERRLEALRSAQGDGKSEQERRISWRAVMGWATAVAAAIAAVVIFIKSPEEKHEDWFAGVGEDQREICQTYYGKMAVFYEAILADDIDEARLGALESIAAENVPMVDQLPDELDPETRAAILKEYYGALLDGMERLNNSVFN